MSAFPIMNPSQGLQGKQALLQKLMAQYQKRSGGRLGGRAMGAGGPVGIGGGPVHMGVRGSVARQGITGAAQNPLGQGALIPRALGGEYSGSPGQGVHQPQISQIPGILAQMQSMSGADAGSPGSYQDVSAANVGAPSAPIDYGSSVPQYGPGVTPAGTGGIVAPAGGVGSTDWSTVAPPGSLPGDPSFQTNTPQNTFGLGIDPNAVANNLHPLPGMFGRLLYS